VESVPAAETQPETEPTEEQAPPTETPTGEEAQPPADPEIEAPSTRIEYSPLEKEAEGIRNTIALPRANERMKQALSEAEKALSSYATLAADVHTLSKPTFEDNKQAQKELAEKRARLKSSKPKYQAIADKLGLTYGQIPLADFIEVQNYPLGQFRQTDSSTGQSTTFAQMAYGEKMPYKPESLGAQADQQFVYWATDIQEPRVPEFSQLYDEEAQSGRLLEAWNLQQALPLAKERAAEWAAKSNKSEQNLREQFAENEELTVLLTNPFSWFTTGSIQTNFQPELSFIASVDMAGMEFMEAAFALNVGEAGVAVNQPHSVVYVVHVVEQSPSTEALLDQFANSQGSQGQSDFMERFAITQIARTDLQIAYQDWMSDLEREFDVKRMR
jgi:hypothetical protein